MKKRVRIYKPVNKFQEGGQSTQYTPDQLMSIYLKALEQYGDPAMAENTLRQLNLDTETIDAISTAVNDYVQQQDTANTALSTGDTDTFEDVTAEQSVDEASALADAEEQARSQEMLDMYSNYSEPDYGDDTYAAQDIIARKGGMPNKRSYVNNVMKLVKKQLGGNQENTSVDSTDPENKRTEGLQKFIQNVQVSADAALIKEDAEKMYEMMTTPIGGDESYYQDEDMDYAQFGGMRRGQARRMNRRMNRMVRNMPVGFYGMPGGPMLPNVYTYQSMMGMMPGQMMPAVGSNYGGPQLANIDVRRTGLFGKPKEYTITFGQDVIANPQTRSNVIKQEVKNKEEEIKDEVTATEEGTVDQGVEEKKAEEAAVDINDIQVISGSRATGATTAKKTSPAVQGKTDKWGRTKDNKWYGYDPKAKKWTLGKPDWTANASTKTSIEKPVSKLTVKESQNLDKLWNKPARNFSKDIERTIGLKKLENTYEDLPDLPSGDAVKRAIGWNKIANTAEDLYEALPDIPRNWGIGESKPIYDKKTGRYYYPNQQVGGFIDSNNPDLYKFVSGGDEGKLTGDPYFQYGGTRQRGMPYISGTNQTYTGNFTNPQLKSIDVKKTRLLSNAPKKYTVNYMVENDPLSKRVSFDDSGVKLDGSYVGQGKGSRRAAGEDNRRFAGNNLSERLLNSGNRPLTWIGSKLKPFQTTSDVTSGIPRDRYDENYKKIYGHYPGEGPQVDLKKELAFQTPTPSEDEQYAPIPEFSSMAGARLPMRGVSPLDQFISREPVQSRQYASGNMFPQEPIPLEAGQEGPATEEDAMYQQQQDAEAQAFEQQRQRDLMGYGMGLLGVPSSADMYMAETANENAMDRQNLDLERMRMQNPDYYSQGPYNTPLNFEALDYTQQQGLQNLTNEANVPIAYSSRRNTRRNMPTSTKTPMSDGNKKSAPLVRASTPVTPPTSKDISSSPKERKLSEPRTAKQRREYDEYIKNSAPTVSNMPGASEEDLYKIEQETKEQNKQLQQGSRYFQNKFGVDKATLNMYKGLLENPSANSIGIQALRKKYPSLLYLEPMIRSGSMAYGGTMTVAQTGYDNDLEEDTSVNYDPRFAPSTKNFSLGNPNTMMNNPFQYQGENKFTGEQSGVVMGNDGQYTNEGLVDESTLPDFSKRKDQTQVSVDYKTKKTRGSEEENNMALDMINTGIRTGLSWIKDPINNDQYLADNLYGSTGQYDRGWIDTNSGLDIPDTYGQRLSAKYGGFYQDGGSYDDADMYEEGGETWMSEADVARFLAEGGELEFI